jgi:peroxiredoxin
MRTTLLFAAALLASTLSAQTKAAPGLSNRRAPSFSLPDTRQQQHDILDYRGKWLFIEFMETKCPHCKVLSKTLDSLRAKHKDKMDVIGVVLPPENMLTVGSYITETKIAFPICFDSSQMAIPYFKATPQHSSIDTPHLFAINPEGWIVADWGQGRAEDPLLVREIEKLLATPIKGK